MSSSSPPYVPAKKFQSAMAAQACETCRGRKTRCDEQRPRCGLCQRLDVDCNYREPKPTKKDTTLLHILDTLQRLEPKIDRLAPPNHNQPNWNFELHQLKIESGADHINRELLPERRGSGDSQKRLTYANRIFTWPAIQTMLLSAGVGAGDELRHLLERGPARLVELQLQKHPRPLSCDVRLRSNPVPWPHNLTDGPRTTFLDLTMVDMKQYADTYFNSFNMIYPILDYEDFMELVMPLLSTKGFGDGCVTSILALSVFALGKLALEGTVGDPVPSDCAFISGIRGGSIQNPPGLDIFNEVRMRLGFVQTQYCLESAQILLLTAIYYEASSRHIDCWQTSLMASQTVQILLRTQHVDWDLHKEDLFRRVFWTCHILESWYRLDMDLPETNLSNFADEIALPLFIAPRGVSQRKSNTQIDYQYNFLGMISIRRLIDRVHETVYDASNAESEEGHGSPPMAVVDELTRQLNVWRTTLPPTLQW